MQIKYHSEKQTTENTAKQNYPGSVVILYETQPGNEAYSTMLLSPGGAVGVKVILYRLHHGHLWSPQRSLPVANHRLLPAPLRVPLVLRPEWLVLGLYPETATQPTETAYNFTFIRQPF